MGLAGLMTGAGASEGLEDLLARMRAEEQLAQRGRSIDIDEREAISMDEHRRGTREHDTSVLGEDVRQFDALQPTRTAGVANVNATAAQTAAETEGITEKNTILKGLRDSFSGTAGADLNNPMGRFRIEAAGMSPNNIYGSVDTANTADDLLLDAYAREIGKGSRKDLSSDEQVAALRKKPNTVISQGNLDIRRGAETDRKQMHALRIKLAERDLQSIPPINQAMAMAEFRNRIANDVEGAPNFAQRWVLGADTPDDPSTQIDAIKADIIKKYGVTAAPDTSTPAAPVAPTAPRRGKFDPATGQITY